MKSLSKTLLTMPTFGVREILNLAVNMPDAIHLHMSEPNFSTPQHIVDAACEAANNELFTKYGPGAGLFSLRELLVKRIQRVSGYATNVAQINVTIGGIQAVLSALLAVLNPGDEVLVPDPAWPCYDQCLSLREATSVPYPLHIENGFIPDIHDLESLVTAQTKILIINSPSNPTGAVFPRETIKALVEFARYHDLYLLSDEVYDEFTFDCEHVCPAIYDPSRVITVYSFSKLYAMTGWRVGYVVANPAVSQLIAKTSEPLISCVPPINQKAAEAALTGPQDCIQQMRDMYRDHRDAVIDLLKASGYYRYTPQGGFFIMMDTRASGLDARLFAIKLLQEYEVAIAPGTAFGEHGVDYVRISLATDKETLLEGVSRICDMTQSLAKHR